MLKVLTDWSGRSNKLERLWLLAKIEFKLRYYENRLGLFWALVKPLTDIFIFYIAFEIILKQGIPDFVSYLFIGLILWNFFVESTLGTIQILKTKKYMYEYTNMNKLEIYISTLLSNSIGFFFNFIMFAIYYQFFAPASNGFTWHIVYILPIFINLTILSLAFSIILSNIYIVAKDITQIWAVVIGIGFWLSPVLYRLSTFREALPSLEYANPISGIIINARNVTLYNQSPDWIIFAFDFGYAIFLLLIGLILMNKLGARASENL